MPGYWETEKPVVVESDGLRIEHYPKAEALHISVLNYDESGVLIVGNSVKLRKHRINHDSKAFFFLNDILKKWRRTPRRKKLY